MISYYNRYQTQLIRPAEISRKPLCTESEVTMTRYEMIVIGGGPAGISAAINTFAYLQA